MHVALPLLLELARLDLQIAEREADRTALPADREALVVERARGAAGVAAAEEALQEAEQEQRRHESRATDGEALVAKLEGQTHQIKSNEAYTALLSEIEAAKAAISEAETAVLEAMEGIESARDALEKAKGAARDIDVKCDEGERACEEREKTADQSLANLRREREGVASGVEAVVLARYDKIALKRTPAVATARKNTCGGCRVAVPPQLLIEMRTREELVACGNCHRILVPEDPS